MPRTHIGGRPPRGPLLTAPPSVDSARGGPGLAPSCATWNSSSCGLARPHCSAARSCSRTSPSRAVLMRSSTLRCQRTRYTLALPRAAAPPAVPPPRSGARSHGRLWAAMNPLFLPYPCRWLPTGQPGAPAHPIAAVLAYVPARRGDPAALAATVRRQIVWPSLSPPATQPGPFSRPARLGERLRGTAHAACQQPPRCVRLQVSAGQTAPQAAVACDAGLGGH